MTHDLIVFAEDWGGLPSSTQHLISHLAKQRKVVWVNSIGLRRPTFSLHDIKRVINKLFSKKNKLRITTEDDNFRGNENFTSFSLVQYLPHVVF